MHITPKRASALTFLGFCSVLFSCQPATSATPDKARPESSAEAERSSQPSEAKPLPVLPLPPGRDVSFAKELSRVTEVRQLESKREILGREVDPQELIAHVERSVALETPEKALLGTENMLVSLGTAPLDFSFKSTMLKLLSENLQGLYDPHLGAMLMRSDLTANRKPTLLHELVHALQDHHFDLGEIVEWSDDDSDRSSALSCLAEGDATSAMFDAMMRPGQTALDLPEGFIRQQFGQTPSDAPPVVVRSLSAPYLDGVDFVNALRRRGGWQEVNRVWKTPPISTEQILHVDKYDAQEAPLDVEIPTPPESGWELNFHDVWGEQSLRLILEDWNSKSKAQTAASGWGGDRLAIYEKDGLIATAWHIQMDSEEDAEQLFQAFAAALINGDSEMKKASSKESGVLCAGLAKEDDRTLALSLKGDLLRVVAAPFSRSSQHGAGCDAATRWLLTQ